jgi:hypothetical protein
VRVLVVVPGRFRGGCEEQALVLIDAAVRAEHEVVVSLVITALERLIQLPQLTRAFFSDPNFRYITA